MFELNLNTETVQSAHPVEPIAVEVGASVRDVFALMKAQRTGSVLICRDGVLAGIFTERDALGLMASGSDLGMSIESVMITNPVTVQPTDTVATAIQRMAQGGYRRLPIVDEAGNLQAIVKVSGIVRYLVEHFPETVYNLPPEPNIVMQDREGA